MYLIKSGELYKIGITEDLRRRIRGLRNQSSARVRPVAHAVVCCQLQAREIERALHLKFQAGRKHGEWFKLDRFEVHRVVTYLRSPWLNLARAGLRAFKRDLKMHLQAEL